jgi:mRNA-degrading endonuclease toxin of MazEF toxin-antitoxin module
VPDNGESHVLCLSRSFWKYNKSGGRKKVTLDQIRAVDRQRLVRKLGTTSSKTAQSVSAVLVEMFARP